VAHCQAAEFERGVACFREAVQLAPDEPRYRVNLGRALGHQRRWREAESALAEAEALAPDNIDIHRVRADLFVRQGRADELAERYRQAARDRPCDPVAKRSACEALLQMGLAEEAAAMARDLVEAAPDDADAGLTLAACLGTLGRLEDRETVLLAVLARHPRHAQAGYELGRTRGQRGEYEAAAAAFENVLRIAPRHLDAMQQLAQMRQIMGQVGDAISLLNRVVKARPNSAQAQLFLAHALGYRGSVDEAVDALRAARALAPDDREIQSALAYVLSLQPSATPAEIMAAHLDWDRNLPRRAGMHRNSPDPERRLRIGYVSPDFWEHSVSYFIEPLLDAHDHRTFEIFGYSDTRRLDATSERIRAACDHWRPVEGRTNDHVADLVEEDGIDILVDLAAHTATNRLAVFARAPAPVQVTWLGYPETTGVRAIGHKITDAVASPPGEAEPFATERLARLAGGFHCYRPSPACPEVAPLPAAAAGYVTFGSFSDLPKVNPAVVALWAAVMRAVPRSRLVMKCRQLADDAVRDKYRAMFAIGGIARDRLVFLERSPTVAAHLQQYADMDICLDTFPYSGTTTLCEALWMGVPAVTMTGDRAAARVGASLLHEVGMPHLVARNQDEFVAIAARLAADVPRLAGLRKGMRAALERTPLRDEPGFARKMEALYRDLWRGWCARVRTAV
jgi:protein O-GlcNAc transferase